MAVSDDDYAAAVAACPTPIYHETHRYCPSCPWTERGPLGSFKNAATADELREMLKNVVAAADRMRDNWAESDKGVRNQLWRDLHMAAEAAHDEVYPL